MPVFSAAQDHVQEPNADFAPNLVNTVCFLVQFIIQLATFAVNYQGPPFNAAIRDTAVLRITFFWGSVGFAVLALDLLPSLTEFVSLVGAPPVARMQPLRASDEGSLRPLVSFMGIV
jgi:cation-transporting ATPase 13A1